MRYVLAAAVVIVVVALFIATRLGRAEVTCCAVHPLVDGEDAGGQGAASGDACGR